MFQPHIAALVSPDYHVVMWAATLAMLFYALEISITDFKLSAIPSRFLTFYYSLGVCTIALAGILIQREELYVPDATTLWFVFLMIGISFVAATAHFLALNQGVGAAKLTLFYALMPVIATFFTALIRRRMPSVQLVLAWILAFAALYLVSRSQENFSLKQ